MIEIVRNRTIRPSSRLEKSKSYKIDTKQVSKGDLLIVNIDHESKSFAKTFKFNGADVAHKDSISFRVNDFGTTIDISWSGADPIGATSTEKKTSIRTVKPLSTVGVIKDESTNLKTSFGSISTADSEVLILGTMPGDKSLLLGEYYGHPRNRFWKIIATITNKSIPQNYPKKIQLLSESKIAVWDVAHQANRKGSLDSAISGEEPNDLNGFIEKHRKLKIICFNGSLSEKIFDKYFERKKDLKYLILPSTSPANTGIDFDKICKAWKQILINN